MWKGWGQLPKWLSKSQFWECFVRLERLRERWKADEIGRWDLLMGDRRFRVSCGENSSNSENWTKAMSITSTAPLSSRNCPLRSSVLFSVKGGYIKAQMRHGHNREFGHYKNKQLSSMVLKIWLWGALKLTIFDEKLICGVSSPIHVSAFDALKWADALPLTVHLFIMQGAGWEMHQQAMVVMTNRWVGKEFFTFLFSLDTNLATLVISFHSPLSTLTCLVCNNNSLF